MSGNFATSKAFESQWRTNTQAQERLKSALQKVYPDRKLLNIHWSHFINDKAGIDGFLEFADGVIISVDFKFRNYRNTEQWVTIETIGDIARNQIGWAGKATPCKEIIFVQSHVNGIISDVLRIDAIALRELVVSRGDDLRQAGEPKRSSSHGKHSSWQGEFVCLTPKALLALLPNRSKHVEILNVGGHHELH